MGKTCYRPEEEKTRSRFGNVEWHVSPCITKKARVALLFIESENYILNDFRFLGCLSRSNNPLHITIHCNDCINAELKTTQSPQRPTEVSLLFENVLTTFVIFSRWIFASNWILQPVQIYTSIAAGIHSKILNHSCHIFMIVNMPADLLYFCLGQPTHFKFCERLDSPAHFDICEG